MKEYHGHLYETREEWHPVIVRNKGDIIQDIVLRSAWLNEFCPDCENDYDAWAYPGESVQDPKHRAIYFFRDAQVAVMFALRWS